MSCSSLHIGVDSSLTSVCASFTLWPLKTPDSGPKKQRNQTLENPSIAICYYPEESNLITAATSPLQLNLRKLLL